VSPQSNIKRTLDKLHANSDTVVSLREPIIIDLSSYYKGQLTEKIELIKSAILESRMIEFDYYYDKGDTHRRIEPHFVIFQWTAWYVFGFCLERQDWRLFKLLRLWNLALCSDSYTLREIPPDKRDFNMRDTDDILLVALFDPTVKYQLIEAYGLDCFIETDAGLLFELSFSNHEYLVSWLLGFGDKVKVIKPTEIADDVKAVAKNIFEMYK
jgi:predicted DNA-binding transcriptional regulator YafY